MKQERKLALNWTKQIQFSKKKQPFTPNGGKRRQQKKQNFYEINSSKLQLNSTLYLYLSYELHEGCYNIQIWKVKITLLTILPVLLALIISLLNSLSQDQFPKQYL